MAKIDRVEDLPEWFDLKKYRGCESFGAAEWLEQLVRRYELLELHPSRVSQVRPETSEDWQAFVLEFWKITMREDAQQVRDAPLDSPSKGRISEWMAAPSNQPVKPLCALDLFWQWSRDKDAEDNGKTTMGIRKRWEVINPDHASVWDFQAHAETPLSLNYYKGAPEIPIIQVDLGASDAVLKAAFASWLKETRSVQRAEASSRSKSLYGRWARYGLLPYLDLLIWAMETETHIPDRVMSAAISRFDAGEANLRKTIAPLAASLVRDLTELKALAAVEAATRTPVEPETFEG